MYLARRSYDEEEEEEADPGGATNPGGATAGTEFADVPKPKI